MINIELTDLSKTHLISEAATEENTFLFLHHPCDTQRLMGHKGDLHSRQLFIEVIQFKILESFVHTFVPVECFDITGGNEELFKAMVREKVSSGNNFKG